MTPLTRDNIKTYAESLGMGAPLVDRSVTVAESVSRLLDEPIQYLAISEYRDSEGSRTYDSMWIFTEKFFAEAHEFVTEDRVDAVPAHYGLTRFEIDREHFDLDVATEASRLTLSFYMGVAGSLGALSGEIKASGENCRHVVEIFENYLFPKIG